MFKFAVLVLVIFAGFYSVSKLAMILTFSLVLLLALWRIAAVLPKEKV